MDGCSRHREGGLERSRVGGEFRVAGRVLSGVALRYGDVAPDYHERFAPGAFGIEGSINIALNLQHDASLVVAPSAVLTDSPRELRVRAELPETSAALALVRRGALNGFSIEFRAREERRDGDGTRVVERADLLGLALVDRPAYPASGAEVRARSGRTVRSYIPADRPMSCECAPGLASRAQILGAALDDMWEHAWREGTKQTVAAFLENYQRPLGSNRRGTLRGTVLANGRHAVELDIPDNAAGRELLDAWESSGIIVRPFIRDIDGEVIDGVRHIRGGRLGAIILTATDAREGWPEPEIVQTPPEFMRSAPCTRRRRIWL